MRIDLPIADTWYEANDRAREFLGLADDSRVSIQTYLGVRHALWEITQALAQTYPHRRMLGYAPFTGPEGDFVALQFAKEGFAVKSLTQDEYRQPKTWLESAAKQMLCLLSAFDDPATGELYQSDTHLAALKDQRIFRVLISHSYHQTFSLAQPGPYEIQIISVKPDLAIAVLGERAKLSPPIASNLDWATVHFPERFVLRTKEQIESAKKTLSEFLKMIPQGVTIYEPEQVSLYDRVLLFVSDVEGFSFITKLASHLRVAVKDPGAESDLETLSICRWQEPKQLEWLNSKGLTPEKLRGTVVISVNLIEKAGPAALTKAISEVHQQLLQEQQL